MTCRLSEVYSNPTQRTGPHAGRDFFEHGHGLPYDFFLFLKLPLFDEACVLLESFEQARLQWIPRHRNAQADALARAALGKLPKRVAKASKD